MRRFLLLACLAFSGCSTRAARVTIPAHCVQVKITDFTKPCPTLPNGDLMCDGVRVHVHCVAAK